MVTPSENKGSPYISVHLIETFDVHEEETFDVRFSQDGKWFLSSDGNALHMRQVESSSKWTLQQHIPCLAVYPRFAPDSKMIVYRNQAQALQLLSLRGELLATLSYPHQTNVDAAFSPDQRWLVSGDSRGCFVVWETATYASVVVQPQLTPSSLWQQGAATSAFRHHLQERFSSANHLLFTPDGQWLLCVAASEQGDVHCYHFHPDRHEILLQKTLPIKGVYDQNISPDGRFLAITSQGTLFLYDVNTLTLLNTCTGSGDAGYTLLAFSPDSHMLASSTVEGNVHIWSTRTWQHLASFAAHPGLVTHWGAALGGLDWSKTDWIATGGASAFQQDVTRNDYTIKMWKVIRKKQERLEIPSE